VITSVDKARELGMDWWRRGFHRALDERTDPRAELAELERRVAELEQAELQGSDAATAETPMLPRTTTPETR